MTRSTSRSAARLAAVQALYQQEMEGTPTTRLIHEFHAHRLGATIGDVTYVDAEESFFDRSPGSATSPRGKPPTRSPPPSRPSLNRTKPLQARQYLSLKHT